MDQLVVNNSGSLVAQFFSGSPVIDVTEKFLNFLGKGGNYQYFWQDSQHKPTWFNLGKIPQIPDWNSVYFCVNPSRVKLFDYSRGGKENISAINCLFGEFDKKDGWTLEKIEKINPAPSIIISSGGGWHCYWLLKETVKVNKNNLSRLSHIQHCWVDFVGSDPASKDISRVLRVPGTFNNKYKPPREVEFIKVDFCLLYDFDELATNLPKEEISTKKIKANSKQDGHFDNFSSDLSFALSCMAKLSPKRVEDYEQWVEVGMALRKLDDVGLQLWDNWSSKSDKYRPGECAAKWETFQKPDEIDNAKSLGSLKHWAYEDSPDKLTNAPRLATVGDYRNALLSLGYKFKLNDMNDDIIINGIVLSDMIRSEIRYRLMAHNYTNREKTFVAMDYEASQNRFHPIIEYLENQKWDGQDHIGKLCSFFEDEENVFPLWMKRWLIGAVAKVLAFPQGQQNRTLILAGHQNLGKSYFVRWLCSGVPAFYYEGAIRPEEKDFDIRLMQNWIWEVAELGSTTRKTDLESLKEFQSKETVTQRKAYGHSDIRKPALSNFIGTVNPESGVLNDPTGSRRYMSCTLTKLNWNYSKEVDINQLWAQAVCLFKSGETWKLEGEEYKLAENINGTFEIENPYAPAIYKYFEIDQDRKDWIMPTYEIAQILISNMAGNRSEYSINQHISYVLRSSKLERRKMTIKGYSKQLWCWIGIKEANINTFE